MTQNLRDCFANISFFSNQDSRELIWAPSFKQQSKKRLWCSAYICVMSILSIICQASENTILLLDCLYLLGKGCTHTTSVSFWFCQTSSAPHCRKEEVKWAQTAQKFRRHSGTVNLYFPNSHVHTLLYRPAPLSCTRNKADQVVAEQQLWLTGIPKRKKKRHTESINNKYFHHPSCFNISTTKPFQGAWTWQENL